MKPAPGHYRLSTPGAPDMDLFVTNVGAKSTLDDWDYDAARDLLVARRLSCAMECTGTGTGLAFVGVYPGFAVPFTCVKLS